MFGQNPIRNKDTGDGTTLRVQDIFPTVQGEGPLAGTPAVFVRLAGCNLRCFFCDTDFESNYDNVIDYERVAQIVANCCHRLVVLTGGEPLLQNVVPLIARLQRNGHKIQIETAGTVWPQGLEDYYTDIVVSPKTPKVHKTVAAKAAAWKYIITSKEECSEADGLPIYSTQAQGKRTYLCRPPDSVLLSSPDRVFLQPCDFGDVRTQYAQQACIEIALRFGYRISLQLHKILRVP